MPNLGQVLGYSLYFSAREGNPLEPVHVHVGFKPSENNTKFWLLRDGTVKLAYKNKNMSNREVRHISSLLEFQHGILCDIWMDFFGEISFYE